ncbi:hypothetical protein GVAV_002811 [Gurleya vavrai]
MERIGNLLQAYENEKLPKIKKEKAKRACYEILTFLKSNPTSENYSDLKNILENLVCYCESLKQNKLKINFNDKKNNEKTEVKESLFKVYTSKDIDNNESVIGMQNIESILEDCISLPMRHPELFTGKRKPCKTILLYGPPGTGKTHILNSILKYDIKMLKITASDLFSKYQGDSEKQIKKLFEEAFLNKPIVVFVDEVDFLCKTRTEGNSECNNRIKSELLVMLSNLEKEKDVYFVGATNFPWFIDSAFVRRFNKRIYIGLPDFEARLSLIKYFLSDNKSELIDKDYKIIAKYTEFFSNSDIKSMCERILCDVVNEIKTAKCFYNENKEWKICLECNLGKSCTKKIGIEYQKSFEACKGKFADQPINMRHFENIKFKSKSSIIKGDLKNYDDWTKNFGE